MTFYGVCPECHENELPPPVGGFRAVRCSPCADALVFRLWGIRP